MAGKTGLFLALEGTDGAGKSSQMTMLGDYFRRSGRPVSTLHFPRVQEKPYGEMIAAFLRGDYGPLDSVHPRLSALLFALDRCRAGDDIRAAVAAGEVVIADRYLYSNIAYQCAKIDGADERRRMADWIVTLEYGYHAIPRPNLTLFLDAPLDFTLRRLADKRVGADRAYLNGKEDIHEADGGLQERVRREFLGLAKSNAAEMAVVDCRTMDGGMADRATIHNRVIDVLRYYAIINT